LQEDEQSSDSTYDVRVQVLRRSMLRLDVINEAVYLHVCKIEGYPQYPADVSLCLHAKVPVCKVIALVSSNELLMRFIYDYIIYMINY